MNPCLKYNTFPSCDIAILCFFPQTNFFGKFSFAVPVERFFKCLHPSHVTFCKFNNVNFVVCSEISDGILTCVLTEELKYYGVKCIIGIGMVEYLDDQNDNYVMIQKIISDMEVHMLHDPIIYELFDIRGSIMWQYNIFSSIANPIRNPKFQSCDVIGLEISRYVNSCQRLNIHYSYFTIIPGNQDTVKCIDNFMTLILEKISVIKEKMIERYEISRTRIMNHLNKLFEDICKSHDINHIIRVTNHVECALKYFNLPLNIHYMVIFATILHDANDRKFFNDDNIKNILEKCFFSDDDIKFIKMMISFVSSSENGDNIPEEAINRPYLLYPRYADRLDGLGKEGVIRCYQYCITKKIPLFITETAVPKDINDVWNIATLERYQNYKGESVSMIDHYYDKLLRLGDFMTDNEYFIEQKKLLLNPLLEIIQAFIDGKLNDTFMNSF